MAGVYVAEYSALLTADGDATGYATVADNTKFPIGAQVFIRDDNSGSQLCQVTDLSGATKVGLRFLSEDGQLNPPQYGVKSDLSAFTMAQNAMLCIPAQVVDEYNAYKKL